MSNTTSLADSQIMSAGYAPDLGDSLAPHVTKSDKGTATQRLRPSSPNALTRFSPAEREAMLLGYRGPTYNYGAKIDQQADAAKTARLIGRTNESRTQ